MYFEGRQQLHTAEYRRPQDFADRRVIVVGGGNSGAQIAGDLAHDTGLAWVTQRPARYLADDMDGRALFGAATARRRALDEGRTDSGGVASLGDIVAVPPVRTGRCNRVERRATHATAQLIARRNHGFPRVRSQESSNPFTSLSDLLAVPFNDLRPRPLAERGSVSGRSSPTSAHTSSG